MIATPHQALAPLHVEQALDRANLTARQRAAVTFDMMEFTAQEAADLIAGLDEVGEDGKPIQRTQDGNEFLEAALELGWPWMADLAALLALRSYWQTFGTVRGRVPSCPKLPSRQTIENARNDGYAKLQKVGYRAAESNAAREARMATMKDLVARMAAYYSNKEVDRVETLDDNRQYLTSARFGLSEPALRHRAKREAVVTRKVGSARLVLAESIERALAAEASR